MALGIARDTRETLTRLGQQHEAVADFEEVVELTRDIKPGELMRAFHTLTSARLGDLSALRRLGNEVREVLNVGAGGDEPSPYVYYMTYYDAASVHATLARLALDDQTKPLAERQPLAQQDLDRALKLLERARATGEFKGMIRLEEVRRDPTLDLLRKDRRFQLRMMDLAFPDSPFGSR